MALAQFADLVINSDESIIDLLEFTEKELSRHVDSDCSAIILDYFDNSINLVWDPLQTGPYLLITTDGRKIQTNPAIERNAMANFGISLGLGHFLPQGIQKWVGKISGIPKYCYFRVAYLNGKVNSKDTEAINNPQYEFHCFFYEYDGDVRGPSGETKCGPPLEPGDELGVIVNFDKHVISFEHNRRPQPVTFPLPKPLPAMLTPIVSVGNKGGEIEIIYPPAKKSRVLRTKKAEQGLFGR
jgi:hypothetical protein